MKLKWMLLLLVLAAAVSGSCGDGGEGESACESPDAGVAGKSKAGETSPELAVLPHDPVNGLLLTAEVLDEERWIVGLTWENVGEHPLSVPLCGSLGEEIRYGYAGPFLRRVYSSSPGSKDWPRSIKLHRGRHSDEVLFDLGREGDWRPVDIYDTLRIEWGLPGDSQSNAFFWNIVDYLPLRKKGDKRTCFFRFPRFKSDDRLERWKEGEKIPVDFRFFVGEEVGDNPRITIKSGADGEHVTHRAPSSWRGEVHSNVIYLTWTSESERVLWRAPSMLGPEPPDPDNGLLLNLEIVDEEEWIVRLTWKNVGDTPIEVPVGDQLKEDFQLHADFGEPLPFSSYGYGIYNFYGRPFGTTLMRGEQGDRMLFDLYRDNRADWNRAAWKKAGFFTGSRGPVSPGRIGWVHLTPGGRGVSVDFKFPRFESDDLLRRWMEGARIPIEFCFKAGEPLNTRPPLREVEENGKKILRRYPAWQGEVYSNVVFFTWTSDGERVKWEAKVEAVPK